MFDTLSLLVLSCKDFFFTQQTPRSGLEIRPGVPSSIATTSEPHETNGATNGGTTNVSRFDPEFTEKVIATMGPKVNPRLRKVIASLIRHLHDFVRENEITSDEYLAGIDLINRAGKMSTEYRNETLLCTDIIGMETLLDEITRTLLAEAQNAPTASALLGPFWRKDAPRYNMSDSIVQNPTAYPHHHAKIYGRVLDSRTGEPIEHAELHIWHDAPNGLYDEQDPDQPGMNLRGRFTTGKDGEFVIYCLRPTAYPIPVDGPGGELLRSLDRHPMRPAHLHFIVSADGYKPVVTQLYDSEDEYLHSDAVMSVMDDLLVDFKELKGDERAQYECEYTFKLWSYGKAK